MFCSAKILTGKKATCFYSIKDDLTNAGCVVCITECTIRVFCTRTIFGSRIISVISTSYCNVKPYNAKAVCTQSQDTLIEQSISKCIIAVFYV